MRDEELIPLTPLFASLPTLLRQWCQTQKPRSSTKWRKVQRRIRSAKHERQYGLGSCYERQLSNAGALGAKVQCCIIFLNQVHYKNRRDVWRSTTSPGGDSPKFYASVRIRLGASVMKDGKDKIGQDVGAECIKNKVAPPFGKCSWKFTSTRPAVWTLSSHWLSMLEEGYLPKNASGRVEIGDKKYTKSQIVDMYRDKPLPEIIAALRAIDERRAKESASAETEEA
ncbi:hypothetical protein [Klebsiella pneumoniae]|uniref:hypothetical protein n=1 Tax=Klebsiella pneumoniae TaxID=573 RepID=UPI002B46E241|nr:hypothetical protein [Klebsiella pneumoniae]